MQLLAKLVFAAALLLASPLLLSDVQVRGMGAALWAALVYGLLFVVMAGLVRRGHRCSPSSRLLAWGCFLLMPSIADALLSPLTADMLGGFDIGSWTSAFLLSAALAVLNAALKQPEPRADFRED